MLFGTPDVLGHHENHEGHEGFGFLYFILSDLRTTMLESFLHLRKFSGSQSCELFRAGLARGQQRRDDVSSFFSDGITMRLRHFCDQAMRPQQPQSTSHRRHLSALFFFVPGDRVEMRTEVTIAKTIERKLPTVDDGHE